jgi:hypothetical protein
MNDTIRPMTIHLTIDQSQPHVLSSLLPGGMPGQSDAEEALSLAREALRRIEGAA